MASWTCRLVTMLLAVLVVSAVVMPIKLRLALNPVVTSELRSTVAPSVSKSEDMRSSLRRATPLYFEDARLQSMANVSYYSGLIIRTAVGHEASIRAAMLHPLLLSSGLYPHLPEQVIDHEEVLRGLACVRVRCAHNVAQPSSLSGPGSLPRPAAHRHSVVLSPHCLELSAEVGP